MYAGRKRRKPLQRTPKPPPVDGVKSNPSKRHRERLNQELERLAGLLPFPEEVTSSLDKLSILRLSVSYLRAKSFFHVAVKTSGSKGVAEESSRHGNQRHWGSADGIMPEGELLLQALNGFVLVITAEGLIFYSSHTIQEYLGFNQTDVMHQSVFELIHSEDQQEFRRNLHWALNPPQAPSGDQSHDDDKVVSSSIVTYKPEQLPPENSVFLERSFVCRFRCLLDNSSGFLALNLQGRLKFLHGQNQRSEDGSRVPAQPALFAISTPLQSPSILEIRTKNMIFRTKHKLDFTPVGCDAKGKIVLGYTETELRMRGTGYQFIHAADMLYCAENHVRMMKTGESGLTVFRLLTKENRWKWVQANARLVYKNGKPDYIIATQRPLVEEEGGDHLRKRSMHLPFTFATGEALLYQTTNHIPGFPDPFQSKGKSKARKSSESRGSRTHSVDPNSLLGAMMRQDESVYVSLPATTPKHSFCNNLTSHLVEPSWPSLDGDSCSTALQAGNGLKPEQAGLGQGDPLLCTLDSLSIGSDDDCSNNDLFNALESLGLNAEDLEMLLLDERMMRVETDPESAPSLNDLLTNNEILSYVHDSFVNQHDQEKAGVQQTYTPANPVQTPSTTPLLYSSKIQEEPTLYLSQHPEQTLSQLILPLPQQMQQYSLAQKQQTTHTCDQPRDRSHWPPLLSLSRPSDHPEQNRHCPSWRQQVQETEEPTTHTAPSSRNGQPHYTQWIRPNGMDLHATKPLPPDVPVQHHHKQNGHLIEEQYQSELPLHPRLPLPNQLYTQPMEAPLDAPAPLQQKNLLTNGLNNNNSVNLTILGSNVWPSYACRPEADPEHTPGSLSWTSVCGDRQGQSFQPQLCSAQASDTCMSTIHFYLNGLSNMGIVDNAGTQECTHQYTGCLYPHSLHSEKDPRPVPPESQCSFQKPSMEHFADLASQMQPSVSTYSLYQPLILEGHANKPGNGCVETGPLPGFAVPGLLPNGNPAPSEELPSHQEAFPSPANLPSSGFYL